MKEEDKLMKLDLKRENQRLETIQLSGIKSFFFRFICILLKESTDNYFCDILFLILQFMQLMAFSMDTVFSEGWNGYWYGTVGHLFRYLQFVFLFENNSQFFIIFYIITILFIIIFLILVIYCMQQIANNASIKFKTSGIISLILTFIEFNTVLSIPFLKILFGVYSCEGNKMKMTNQITCKNGVHLGMMVISCIIIIIYLLVSIIFKMTFFEFGVVPEKLKSAFTSSTEVLLIIMKFLLVLIYQFIHHKMALSVITLFIGIYLFFDFIGKQPFTNTMLSKIYLTLYLLFLWSGLICIIALLLKNTQFQGGILLLLIGYPGIILTIVLNQSEYSIEKLFEQLENKYKDGYKFLKEIEYFLGLEESLDDKIRPREQKILYSYINNYELNCTDTDCSLKDFLKIPLKVENFADMKICLLQHAELLYKVAVSKFPFDAKLRLSYALFLYKKLNKKQKGTNELLILNTYTTNLEDAFLIFKAQKLVDDEKESRSDDDMNNKAVSSMAYKAILNNIKVIIGKITMNYIDFWTILANSDETKSENFQKMSKIGNKISKLNQELINDFERLERFNLYDQDTIRLYSQYLIEILNDHSAASSYNTKLMELEQTKHQFNEENIFDLNYKAMSRSEDYKYIVINCSPSNLGVICNISLSVFPLFGFSKDELIGRPIDYILPEIINETHKKKLQENAENFRKVSLVKNKNINNKARSEGKMIESFARTKMKYLVPIKMKVLLVSTEDGDIFGIAKIIIENPTINEIEQQIAYVLTDKDFFIHNFTPNSPKLLCLQSSTMNNNLDITEFIEEFYTEYYKLKGNNNNEIKGDEKFFKQMKIDLIKKMFFTSKKLINWRLGDILNGDFSYNSKDQKFVNRTSILKTLNMTGISKQEEKYHSAMVESNEFNLLKSGSPTMQKLRKKNFKIEDKSFHLGEKQNKNETSENKDINHNYLSIKDNSHNSENEYSVNENYIKPKDNKNYFIRKIYHKFFLSVSELKVSEVKLGYIFKFELLSKDKTTEDNSLNALQNFKNIFLKRSSTTKNNNDNLESEKLESSNITFKNASNIGINRTSSNGALSSYYIPTNSFQSEFTIDINKMSYKQIGQVDKTKYQNPSIVLQSQAIEILNKIRKNNINKKEEDESEDSEEDSNDDDSYTNSEKSSKNSHSSNKNEIENNEEKENNINKNVPINDIFLNNNQTFNYVQKKEEEEDYYHVNDSHITLFVYNFNTGFLEPLKEQKFKISQVVKQINLSKQTAEKVKDHYIYNKSGRDKTRDSNNNNKKIVMEQEESDTYSEKKIKIKEIQKALTSKEKQSSIVNLCIFSFVVIILIIGSSIASLSINIYLKGKAFTYYHLVEKSVTLYKDITFELFFVREMVLIANPLYNNTYDEKNLYFKNYSESCYNYYLETSYLLSNLSTSINTLNEKKRNEIINKKGNLSIIDPLESKEYYQYRTYTLLIYSAFHEINAALYHISQMNLTNIHEYEDNIYYFIKNGMNFMLGMTREQIEIFAEEFYNEVKKGHILLIVCIIVVIIIYIVANLIFFYFYQKVEERKQSYLSAFYEIGNGFIVSSLEKCEKFSTKIHIQDNSIIPQNDRISMDASNENSNIEETVSTSSVKQNKDVKNKNTGKIRNVKILNHTQTKLVGLIVFLILLAVQIATYYYYYVRLTLYKKCVQYEYYDNQYNFNFLFPFIVLREYLYQPKGTIFRNNINDYLENLLDNFYTELANLTEYKDKYSDYLPTAYSKFLENLYNEQQCSFLDDFINERINHSLYQSCGDFFYRAAYYGFKSILVSYIEEVRVMKDFGLSFVQKAAKNNFKYNESLCGTTFYKNLYNIENVNYTLYNETNSILILREDIHQMTVIVFRFVIVDVVEKSFSFLFTAVRQEFDDTNRISLLINIIFIVVVAIGFSAIWLPFVMEENETIYKTKNMLSIIPKEVLLSLPHINAVLGLDEDGD